eukprot:scaffold381_cov168-Ochromonas_danica.AAC.7
MSSRIPSESQSGLIASFDRLQLDNIQHWLREFSSWSSDNTIIMNFSTPSLGIELMRAPLVERHHCALAISKIFSQTARAYLSSSRGRENYRIPVLVGMPGIGKSRMLNEYKQFLPKDAGFVVASFVVYNNGHSVTRADTELEINRTFAARLLH